MPSALSMESISSDDKRIRQLVTLPTNRASCPSIVTLPTCMVGCHIRDPVIQSAKSTNKKSAILHEVVLPPIGCHFQNFSRKAAPGRRAAGGWQRPSWWKFMSSPMPHNSTRNSLVSSATYKFPQKWLTRCPSWVEASWPGFVLGWLAKPASRRPPARCSQPRHRAKQPA